VEILDQIAGKDGALRRMIDEARLNTLVAQLIAALELDVTFFVTVVVNSPCYKCSIDGDGQFISFELVHPDFPNRRMELNIVMAG
jgi:hypothetical protein